MKTTAVAQSAAVRAPLLLLFLLTSSFTALEVTAQRTVYPQAVVGPVEAGAFEIELRLGNRGDGAWLGRARFLRNTDLQGMAGLSVIDGNGNAVEIMSGIIAIDIPAQSSILYRVESDSLQQGVLVLEAEPTSSAEDLVAAFYYLLLGPEGRVSDVIAIQGQRRAQTGYRLMLSSLPTFNVGLAAVAEKSLAAGPASSLPTRIDLTAVYSDGTEQAMSLELGGGSDLQRAFFPDEIISQLGHDIPVAQLKVRANDAIFLTTLAVGAPPDFDSVQIGAAPAEPDVDVPFSNLQVNVQDREAVIDFYETVYRASDGVSVRWNGNEASCAPGTVSALFQQSLLRRINYFRAMAGVPSDVSFDPELDEKSQQLALMMVAENRASHSPDPSWKCYTAGGAEAAPRSNLLYLPGSVPTATSLIDTYLRDDGNINGAVGHRRWMLLPTQRVMGSGTVQTPEDSAHALWIRAPRAGGPRIRSAWPPAGFVPAELVFPRWSFSFPEADFSAASVHMSEAGQSVALDIEPVVNGFGDNTIVWVPQTLFETPPADLSYQVTISNVLINSQPQNFDYTVTVVGSNR